MIGAGVFLAFQGLVSTTWLPVEGEIGDSSYKQEQGDGGGRYVVKVSYTFPFQGTNQTGSRIDFGANGKRRSRNQAEAWVRGWAPHSVVTVYVDPHNTGRSVLLPGFKGECLGWSYLGMGWLGLLVFGWLINRAGAWMVAHGFAVYE